MKDFFKGMMLINLFPIEKKPIKFTPLSIQDVFKKSLDRVGTAMYHAIDAIDIELKDLENNGKPRPTKK